MYTIKRLSECTLEEIVKAWNDGFEGYYFDATTTSERLLRRMADEGLSPELSVVAFDGSLPIGLVLNGVRHFEKEVVSWNGGTGVAKDYRGKGVGRLLIEKCLDIYYQEGVTMATLEAIKQNKKAIDLYEKLGYTIVDNLEMLSLNGKQEVSSLDENQNVRFVKTIPQEVSSLPFYKYEEPWQTHWQSARDGEAVLAMNENEETIGYVIYKRVFDRNNHHMTTLLYQCVAKPSLTTETEIINGLLYHAFDYYKNDIKRTVINISEKENKTTAYLLKQIGFIPTVEQVYMKLSIN